MHARGICDARVGLALVMMPFFAAIVCGVVALVRPAFYMDEEERRRIMPVRVVALGLVVYLMAVVSAEHSVYCRGSRDFRSVVHGMMLDNLFVWTMFAAGAIMLCPLKKPHARNKTE